MSEIGGALFVTGGALSRSLPSAIRYGVARAGGLAGYQLLGRVRRQALENYAGVLHQPESSPEVHRVAREAIVGYTKLLADFVLLPQLTPDRVRRMVDWEGIEHIHAAREKGRGVIVVTPHFGNWDIAAAATTAVGLPVTAVTEHYGTSDLNRRVVEARERIGMNVVPVGPAVLALRSGAPVLPFVCRRLPDDRYRVEVQPPVVFEPGAGKERDVELLAQSIMDRFDPILRASPEQWYLFSPMWHTNTEAAAESKLAVVGLGLGGEPRARESA